MKKFLFALLGMSAFCGAADAEPLSTYCFAQINPYGDDNLYACGIGRGSTCVLLHNIGFTEVTEGTMVSEMITSEICYTCDSNGWNRSPTFVCSNNGTTRELCTQYSYGVGTCSKITSGTSYRCRGGYYGSTSQANSDSCPKCPCMTDTGGATRCGVNTPGSNATLGTCIMSSTYTFNDVGDYKFTSNCSAS
ncbi:MAG: hypothetical protein LBK26_00925 [Rickettsiales bacterium]|jgi:hypothetical protein|nr:hypothetical protein [Rickettsiales bacterium]